MIACGSRAATVVRLYGAPAYVYACGPHTTAAVRLLAQLTTDPDAAVRITALTGGTTPCSITRHDTEEDDI